MNMVVVVPCRSTRVVAESILEAALIVEHLVDDPLVQECL
jgi:hypothetical protein